MTSGDNLPSASRLVGFIAPTVTVITPRLPATIAIARTRATVRLVPERPLNCIPPLCPEKINQRRFDLSSEGGPLRWYMEICPTRVGCTVPISEERMRRRKLSVRTVFHWIRNVACAVPCGATNTDCCARRPLRDTASSATVAPYADRSCTRTVDWLLPTATTCRGATLPPFARRSTVSSVADPFSTVTRTVPMSGTAAGSGVTGDPGAHCGRPEGGGATPPGIGGGEYAPAGMSGGGL